MLGGKDGAGPVSTMLLLRLDVVGNVEVEASKAGVLGVGIEDGVVTPTNSGSVERESIPRRKLDVGQRSAQRKRAGPIT